MSFKQTKTISTLALGCLGLFASPLSLAQDTDKKPAAPKAEKPAAPKVSEADFKKALEIVLNVISTDEKFLSQARTETVRAIFMNILQEEPREIFKAYFQGQKQLNEDLKERRRVVFKDNYQTITQDKNNITIGNADAPVVLTVFFDYTQADTISLFRQIEEITNVEKPGYLKVVFIPVRFSLQDPNLSALAELGQRCAFIASDKGKFLEFSKKLFEKAILAKGMKGEHIYSAMAAIGVSAQEISKETTTDNMKIKQRRANSLKNLLVLQSRGPYMFLGDRMLDFTKLQIRRSYRLLFEEIKKEHKEHLASKVNS